MQPLALTLGEPAGIGPDLALAIWHRRSELDVPPFYLVADPDFLKSRAEHLRLDVPIATVTPRTAAATPSGSSTPTVAPAPFFSAAVAKTSSWTDRLR